MTSWLQAFRLVATLLLGCGAAWGLMLVLVLAFHVWPYPTLALFCVVGALVLRGRGR
jgi:hypothetical protein